MALTMEGSRKKLYFSVFVVNLIFFSCGCIFGWTSPTILKLQSPDSWLPITDAEASWIVSLLSGGAIIGPLMSGALLDSIGRKATILIVALLLLLSWILLAIATSPYVMYAARVIAGLGVGSTFSVVPIYIAEIAEDSVRSAVNTVMQLFLSSGILLAYCVGPYISYLQLVMISMTSCILFLIYYPWLRESPYHLISKNDTHTAISNLQWLRGDISQSSIEQEIKNIQVTVAENMSKKGTVKEIFATPGCRQALFIACGLLFWQQISGMSIILFYTEPIFKLSGTTISTSLAAIIFGVAYVIIGAVSPPLINHLGYKKPLIISAAVMIVSHGTMGVFLYLAARNYNVQPFNWIPVVALIGYVVGNGIGFGNIPWAIMGELFPTHVKATGSAVSTCFCSVLGFLTSNLFPDLVNSIGMHSVFGLFSLLCVCAIVFVVFIVPDTNGMSLAQIQELLNNPKSCKMVRQKANDKILQDHHTCI